MLNLAGITRAPMYEWRVSMKRCHTVNQRENEREQVEYVFASNEADAKREAKRKRPMFHAESARRI